MIDLIPIAQLARFGGVGRTAVVWWSDVDESIVGLYADLHIAKERREIARRRRAFTRRVDEVRASREDTP